MLRSETLLSLTAAPVGARPSAPLSQVSLQRKQSRRVVTVLAALNQPESKSVPPDVELSTAAWREPVAFLGGIFAGFLGLSLDQDPLKEWIQETATGSQGMDASTTAIVPVKDSPLV